MSTSPEYLNVYQDGNDSHLRADCPACYAELSPHLHMPKATGACQAGCSKEWQTAGPHLRWSCERCGWSASDACSRPVRDLTFSGKPVEIPVEELAF